MEADHIAVNTCRTPISKRILIWERKPATESQAAYGQGRVHFGTKTPRTVLTACPLYHTQMIGIGRWTRTINKSIINNGALERSCQNPKPQSLGTFVPRGLHSRSDVHRVPHHDKARPRSTQHPSDTVASVQAAAYLEPARLAKRPAEELAYGHREHGGAVGRLLRGRDDIQGGHSKVAVPDGLHLVNARQVCDAIKDCVHVVEDRGDCSRILHAAAPAGEPDEVREEARLAAVALRELLSAGPGTQPVRDIERDEVVEDGVAAVLPLLSLRCCAVQHPEAQAHRHEEVVDDKHRVHQRRQARDGLDPNYGAHAAMHKENGPRQNSREQLHGLELHHHVRQEDQGCDDGDAQ